VTAVPSGRAAERPSYEALSEGWRRLAAERADLRLGEVPCPGAGDRSLLLAEFGAVGAPALVLSAGVHGDEPAGPWALLSVVRDGLLDEQRFVYRCWACTNPSGYRLGTRANADGDDINRSFTGDGATPESRAIIAATADRHFVLALDLHEDYEADGFYCYEPPVGAIAPFGLAVLQAIDDAGIPIQDLTHDFDLGYPPDARHLRVLERGRCLANIDEEIRFFSGLPYSMRMLHGGHIERSLTFESPCKRPWELRIAAHRVAITAALAAFTRWRARP
jgi:hypothetical protein